MSIADAFLADIIEHPDDDAPRLIYADWLDDNGDPARAEFIRTQVALAAMSADDPWRHGLTAREAALLGANRKAWELPFAGLARPVRFRRGFVEVVELHAEDPFAGQLKAAVALAPIRTLHIGSQFVNGRHLHRAAPYMTRLRRLEFGYPNFHPGGGHAATFFRRPELRNLTALHVMGDRNGSGLTEDIARAVIGSPAFPGLTDLTLIQDFRGLSAALIRELATAPERVRLERLSLQQSTLDAQTVRLLGNSRFRLTELDLSHCTMPTDAWEALTERPGFTNLRRLHLWDASVTLGDNRRLSVGRPLFPNMYGEQPELRAAVLERSGSEVTDFDSEAHYRWWEGVE